MRFPRFVGSVFATLVVAATLVFVPALPASAMETSAKQAFVVDFDTSTVLLEKNADTLMPPSSMSKLMTIYMLFDRLKEGSVSLTDEFSVSERAWRTGGSKMFVQVGSRVKVEDLLRGIIIASGNDACVVVAENLAPSEAEFAGMLTKKGREIGLQHSTFKNAAGLPHPEHMMTARDLAVLARRIIADFPQYYPIFKDLTYTYNNIQQGNRNPLLYQPATGADGLKTGHTEAGGYGLTASAIRDGRRLIMVLNGLESMKARAQESERLIDWAFREFDNVRLFAGGETVVNAEVWLGDKATVPLVPVDTIRVTLPRRNTKDMKVAAVYQGPIAAPIRKGDRLAALTITSQSMPPIEIPLVAGEDVERLGFVGRLGAAAKSVIFGSIN
ncbi:MAG: D-alanyl-D-alanine carboxypeptidase family protein [Alphaproteobacteria bacterium]